MLTVLYSVGISADYRPKVWVIRVGSVPRYIVITQHDVAEAPASSWSRTRRTAARWEGSYPCLSLTYKLCSVAPSSINDALMEPSRASIVCRGYDIAMSSTGETFATTAWVEILERPKMEPPDISNKKASRTILLDGSTRLVKDEVLETEAERCLRSGEM